MDVSFLDPSISWGPVIPTASEIETAHADLEQDFDETTLLPDFVARDLARIYATIEMIADGFITADMELNSHSLPKKTDTTSGEHSTKLLSFLCNLIEEYRYHPDVSAFRAGRVRFSRTPRDQLLEDMSIVQSLLRACRANRADRRAQHSANDPQLIARCWSVFIQRMASLQPFDDPDCMNLTYCRGLGAIERLPNSTSRAASGQVFACLVKILHPNKRYTAFKSATQLVLETPDETLICKIAASLIDLEPCLIKQCASYLMRYARRLTTCNLPTAIGRIVDKSGEEIDRFFDNGRLNLELMKHLPKSEYQIPEDVDWRV